MLSTITSPKLGELQQSYDDCKCTLDERDQELDALRPMAEELVCKIEEYEQSTRLEEVKTLEQKLHYTTGRLESCSNMVDSLESENKSKDRTIKSLKDDIKSNQSKEMQLQSEVRRLKMSVTAYETEFDGMSVDVPMLLAN